MSADAVTLLAEATGQPAAEIPADADITSVTGWDSIAHMRLILAVEEQLGRKLDVEEILDATSLPMLQTLLAS